MDELGPLTGKALVVIDLHDTRRLDALARLGPVLPCVVVGVGDPAAVDPVMAGALADVLLTAAPPADLPEPWVSAPDGDIDASVGALQTSVDQAPQAAVVLAQVLRATLHGGVAAAIATESLAYGLLQAGDEFAGWLSTRPPMAHKSGDGPPVLVDRDGGELTITLNRPDARNAYDAAMRDALFAALELVVEDNSIEAVHLRGAGPAFSAGGDLAEFGTAPDPVTGHFIRSTRSAPGLLACCANRVTAHVHGACVGAGIELPAFASRVVAHPDTTFSLPEVGMGLIPGAGGTASIPRRIGRHRTAWLALTGTQLDAATAVTWGLVDELST